MGISDLIDIKAPSLGEGIHSMKIIKFLKGKNSIIQEDDNLIEVETNKTIIEIPSPVQGRITDFFCQEGDELEVGSNLLRIEATNNINKLSQNKTPAAANKVEKIEPTNNLIEEPIKLSNCQKQLAINLQKSSNIVIAANISSLLDWSLVSTLRSKFRNNDINYIPSATEVISWAVIKTMHQMPKFRYRCNNQLDVHESRYAQLGIAISLDNDDLAISTIKCDYNTSVTDVSNKIRNATTYINREYHSVALSNMSPYGIYNAAPVVVYPAIATLFIGSPYLDYSGKKVANIVLAFDHRIINGVYAANFIRNTINNIKKEICNERTEYN